MFKLFFFTLRRNQIKVQMKRVLFTLIGLILLSLGTAETASAQRTATGKAFIGVNQFVSGYAIPSGGLGIEGGQYLVNSYWKAGVRAVDWNQKVADVLDEDGDRVWFDHILWNLSGSWMYRVAGSYSRRFNLYIGAGAFLGLNHYEVFKKLPSELRGEFPKVEFVYGVDPELEFEIFPFRKVALVLGIQSPLTFSSSLSTDFWHLSASLGIRINL